MKQVLIGLAQVLIFAFAATMIIGIAVAGMIIESSIYLYDKFINSKRVEWNDDVQEAQVSDFSDNKLNLHYVKS